MKSDRKNQYKIQLFSELGHKISKQITYHTEKHIEDILWNNLALELYILVNNHLLNLKVDQGD